MQEICTTDELLFLSISGPSCLILLNVFTKPKAALVPIYSYCVCLHLPDNFSPQPIAKKLHQVSHGLLQTAEVCCYCFPGHSATSQNHRCL